MDRLGYIEGDMLSRLNKMQKGTALTLNGFIKSMNTGEND